MRFDIYGRYQIDMARENGAWVAYRVGAGLRTPIPDLVIPSTARADELEIYLNDLLHELAEPGRAIRRVA